jgi:hypothetical protein
MSRFIHYEIIKWDRNTILSQLDRWFTSLEVRRANTLLPTRGHLAGEPLQFPDRGA